MASLQERTGTSRVIFRFHGKQHLVMIGKVSPAEGPNGDKDETATKPVVTIVIPLN